MNSILLTKHQSIMNVSCAGFVLIKHCVPGLGGVTGAQTRVFVAQFATLLICLCSSLWNRNGLNMGWNYKFQYKCMGMGIKCMDANTILASFPGGAAWE